MTENTVARYSHLTGKKLISEFTGDIIDETGVIFRMDKNCLLHNGNDDEPAIDCPDGHIEFWIHGELKKVIDINIGIKEIWQNGMIVETKKM